jgi:hypothetical protein
MAGEAGARRSRGRPGSASHIVLPAGSMAASIAVSRSSTASSHSPVCGLSRTSAACGPLLPMNHTPPSVDAKGKNESIRLRVTSLVRASTRTARVLNGGRDSDERIHTASGPAANRGGTSAPPRKSRRPRQCGVGSEPVRGSVRMSAPALPLASSVYSGWLKAQATPSRTASSPT